jgi:hypothetical protein
VTSLKEFSPLERLQLHGIGAIDCTGLILVVGPNSSGKSQLLRDIHERTAGSLRELVVASEVAVRRLPYEPLVAALSEAGFLQNIEDEGGTKHVRPTTTYAGTGQHAAQMQMNQIQSWHQVHDDTWDKPRRRRDEYLGYFGRLLVTSLFLEHRLISLNRTGLIDFLNSPPQHDLHALYLSDTARQQLFEEIRASFAKGVWPDISSGTGICLRVSDGGAIPSAEERLSPKTMNRYRSIESEGDGLKSYVAICVALLLGRRPVCLIDEPEMCLHPPQAYNLGQFIGEYGVLDDAVAFVATHSSHVLRGVIQKTTKLQIVRLTKHGVSFRAHIVSPETLEHALQKPTMRAESVLDGLFSQAVVIVEADGDRTVYQAVWETLGREIRLDIHFATVGTGGIADTCHLYSVLKIPVAVIADLDVIRDADRLQKVLNALRCTEVEGLVQEAQHIVHLMQDLSPTISESDARSQIASLVPQSLSWSKKDDVSLVSGLRDVARQLDRMRRFKSVKSEPLYKNSIRKDCL